LKINKINSDQGLTNSKYVRVAVNIGRPTRMLFSYHLKDGMKIESGFLVLVPFAKRILQGIVVEGPLDLSGYSGKTRPVDSILDNFKPISPNHLKLAKWISSFYLSPQWETFSIMFPPGISQKPIETLKKIIDTHEPINDELKGIYNNIPSKGIDAVKLKKKYPKKFNANIDKLISSELIKKVYSLPILMPKNYEFQHIEMKKNISEVRDFLNSYIGSRKNKTSEIITFMMRHPDAITYEKLVAIYNKMTINKLITKKILNYDLDSRLVIFDLQKLSMDEILDLTCLAYERTAKKILTFFIDKSNYIESYISTQNIKKIFGSSSNQALEFLFYLGMIKYKNLVESRDRIFPSNNELISRKSLTKEQKSAVSEITDSIKSNLGKSFVIYGSRESGKLETCLSIIKNISVESQRSLVISPSIANSAFLYSRFKEFFDSNLTLINSDSSKKNFLEKWHNIQNSDYDVIISTKFGFTLPINNLKLIVITEAENFAYKQNFSSPRYDLRDVAEYLSLKFGITIVYLTTTMNADLWLKAYQEKITKIHLSGKINRILQSNGHYKVWSKQTLPNIRLNEINDPSAIFSSDLLENIKQNIEKSIQSIIIMNRRGFAKYLICKCGKKILCENCYSPMSVQQESKDLNNFKSIFLFCYQCGNKTKKMKSCDSCRSDYLPLRAGTNMAEDLLHKKIKDAKIIRLDSDSVLEYGTGDRLLNAVKNADIILGTKKILDIQAIPSSPFVCLLLPEYNENEIDYRYQESIFQLIMESIDFVDVNNPLHKVVIQSINPHNFIIQNALNRNVDAFYRKELEWRSLYEYPPYTQILKLEFNHNDGSFAAEEANRLYKELIEKIKNNNIKILGPIKLQKDIMRNKQRWIIYLKGQNANIHLSAIDIPIGWQVDLNPMEIN
jgi:primosomal protein N' (replication factor Y) (superfamily II helicase)